MSLRESLQALPEGTIDRLFERLLAGKYLKRTNSARDEAMWQIAEDDIPQLGAFDGELLGVLAHHSAELGWNEDERYILAEGAMMAIVALRELVLMEESPGSDIREASGIDPPAQPGKI